MSYLGSPTFRSKKKTIIWALKRMEDYFTTPENIKELFTDEVEVAECKKINCYYKKELLTNSPDTWDFGWDPIYMDGKIRFSVEFGEPIYLPSGPNDARDLLYEDCEVMRELNLCTVRRTEKEGQWNFYFLTKDSKHIKDFKKAMKKRLKGVWKK